jgi:hypothetical protein
MREYSSVILPDPPESIQIKSLPEYYIQDWDLSDSKQLHKFFYSIERVVRQSHSYKKLINFLREHVDMNCCSFYKNINNIDTNSIHIEIHHEPFTLFDIVNIVYSKRLALHEPLTENQIAKEVLWNHYRMAVGLIPLSETVHELVHNGFIFIPTTSVFGYYKKFYEDYKDFIDPSIKKVLQYNEQTSLEYDFQKNTKVLTMKAMYLDTSGAYEFPNTEDIVNLMKQKIEDSDKSILEKQIV